MAARVLSRETVSSEDESGAADTSSSSGKSTPAALKRRRLESSKQQPEHSPKRRKAETRDKVPDKDLRSDAQAGGTVAEEQSTSEEEESDRSKSSVVSDDPDDAQAPTPTRVDARQTSGRKDHDRQTQDAANGLPTPNPSSTAPARSYQPPTGFEKMEKAGSTTNTRMRKVLEPRDLVGKEVWSISAPASLPLSKVAEVTLNKFQGGDACITYADEDYQFAPENGPSSGIMLPSVMGRHYEAVQCKITYACTLKRRPKHLDDSRQDEHRATTGATVQRVKEIPKQPAGLRARFWPAGFEAQHPVKAAKGKQMDGTASSSSDGRYGSRKSINQKSKTVISGAESGHVSSSSESAIESSDEGSTQGDDDASTNANDD